MPTTIDSAGIIFNDASTITSANTFIAKPASPSNGQVLGYNGSTWTGTSLSASPTSAKAWVNFNGAQTVAPYAAPSGNTLIVTSGSNIGTWVSGTWTSAYLGVIYYFNIGGTNQTLGGVNVSTVGIQITNIISSTQANFILLAGNATSSQTVNGNGTNSGFLLSSSGIRSSYNVSSITKNGTGDYTVNFTTPMADANYSVVGMSRNNHAGSTDPNTGYGASICISRTTDPTINAVRVWNVGLVATGAAANIVSLQDPTTIGITIFGN